MSFGDQEMGCSRDGDCSTQGFQELCYEGAEGLTRAVFCVAKAQDAIDAAKQRLSSL